MRLGIFDFGIFNRYKTQDLPHPPNTPLDVKYLEKILEKWLKSPTRAEQLLAEAYYDGDHDILRRERKVMNAEGTLSVVHNLPNNKIVDNQYRKLVDQKTNYVLGKPLSIATEKSEYLKLLTKVFNKKVHRQLRVLAQYAVDGGIAWLCPTYDGNGEFVFTIFPSYEICPLWKDKSHIELDGVMRYYSEEVFDKNGGTKLIYHVEVFTLDGIYPFLYQGASLIPNGEFKPYITYNGQSRGWNRLPMIPFKYNAKETPLIRNVKSLQDKLNDTLSDFANNMEEDPRNTILVLKNYDGTNIPEFRQNLATYGVIKVTTVDGVQGGVETLKVEVDAANYQAELMQLKRAIIENGRGFDAKEERMDGDPNQMNIESMYTDIDLDVNAMETEFQGGFEDLKWFIDQYLIHQGHPDYSEEDVEFVFNRDIFINEDAKIENCIKSVGVISNNTILARHPWVTNVEHELQQIEDDKQTELKEMEATMKVQAKANPQTNGSGGNKKEQ